MEKIAYLAIDGEEVPVDKIECRAGRLGHVDSPYMKDYETVYSGYFEGKFVGDVAGETLDNDKE